MEIPVIIETALMIVGAASCLAKITPTLSDDNIIAKIKQVLEFISLNNKK